MPEELTAILSEGHWIAVCWNLMGEAIAWRKLGTDMVIYAEDYDDRV